MPDLQPNVETALIYRQLRLDGTSPEPAAIYITNLLGNRGLKLWERPGLTVRIKSTHNCRIFRTAGNKRIKLLRCKPMMLSGESMAAAIQPVHNSGESALPSTPRPCSVIRQPILDLRGRVHAYELLFRRDAVPDGTSVFNNLIETAGNFGLEKPSELKKLTGKLTAFVRCPLEALNEQLALILPASLTVLEIGPPPEVSPELVSSCRQLEALGFRFALDDFSHEPQRISLLELADYITVDFCSTTAEVHRGLLDQLRGKPTMTLAKGVHTHPNYPKNSSCRLVGRMFGGVFGSYAERFWLRCSPAGSSIGLSLSTAPQLCLHVSEPLGH